MVGYLFSKLDCDLVPLLLGYVLGPQLEEHVRRAMLMSRGNPDIFVTRPISAALMVLAFILIIAAIVPSIKRRRQQTFIEDEV